MMTSKERILTALNLKEPDQVPFADWVDPAIRKQLCQIMGATENDDADFAKKIGFDAIDYMGFYDLCPIADETYVDNQGRKQSRGKGLIRTENDLDMLKFPDPSDEAIFDEAKRFVDRYGNEGLALYAGFKPAIEPIILSLGWETFSDALYDNPGFIERAMDRYIEWHCEVIEKVQMIGFDFFKLYDDIAGKSGPLFSPQHYREIFLPGMRTLANTIKLPWAYHSDGDLTLILDDLLSLGMNAINPIEPPAMDIRQVKEKYGDRICLWGNIDLVYTLTQGTPDEVDAEVKQRIQEVGHGGGYILATGNTIADFCKVENVLAMAKAVKKYGRYPL